MTNDAENALDEETFGCGDSENGDSLSPTDFQCEICRDKLKSPRVLPCLHVFCLSCLQKRLDDETQDGYKNDYIICPSCSHKTSMDGKPASSLLVAFVNANILDMDAVRAMTVVCTSCKSEDTAVARCADCANFLCPSCNKAHKEMRCFENHHVRSLDELKETSSPIPIHKSVMCNKHPIETIKFFCLKCELPLCGDCVGEHKLADHAYERVTDAEAAIREELKQLVEQTKERIDASDETGANVIGALSELQSNHDNARSLIEETFQSYKAILEECRDTCLEKLTDLHNDKELAIMEVLRSIESARPHMEMAVAFTNALIELGDSAEIVASHRVVRSRLRVLLASPMQPELDVNIEFKSNLDDFKRVAQKYFGNFGDSESKSRDASPTTPNSLPDVMDGMKDNEVTSSPIISNESTGLSLLGSTISIPTSGIMSSGDGSPTSLKSSCDSELSALSALSSPFNLRPTMDLSSPPLSQVPTPNSGYNVMYNNIQRLANLELDTPPSHQTQDSFNLAGLLGGDLTANHAMNAMNNIQALAKLTDAGNNSLDNSGHGNGMIDNVYGNLSTQSPPALNDLSGLNGFNGLNSSMNGMGDYSQSIVGMMGRRMPNLNVSNPLNGLNGLNPLPGLTTPPLSAINGLNAFPLPRQTSSNTASMTVRCKYGQLGSAKGQFNSPHGFCLGNDEEVIVADTNNHRIQIFERDGTFKYQFGVSGREEGQLWYPRKVALMKKCGKFVVCDRGNERSRMQIFTKNGHFVRKISIRYIDIVAGLAVTSDGFIVAVDSVSPTVFILNELGVLLQWFDCANYMREPSDIAISGESLRQKVADQIARAYRKRN